MVDDIWIPLGENILIERFKPLWNQVIDGFGNNDPGGRRATQYRSHWDVLHPGKTLGCKTSSRWKRLQIKYARKPSSILPIKLRFLESRNMQLPTSGYLFLFGQLRVKNTLNKKRLLDECGFLGCGTSRQVSPLQIVSLQRLHGVFRPQILASGRPRDAPISDGILPFGILHLLDLTHQAF